jgi:hypothetical protein
VEGQFDLAIHAGSVSDSSLVQRRLGKAQRVICASPIYLARRGTPQTPQELAAHNCLSVNNCSRIEATGAFLLTATTLFSRIAASPKPTIAAVNGIAVGGGLELLLACDIILAARGALIGDGHAKYGLLPGAGSSVRLPRRIGIGRAKQLLFSGELSAWRSSAWSTRSSMPRKRHRASRWGSSPWDIAELEAEFKELIIADAPIEISGIALDLCSYGGWDSTSTGH